MENTKHWYESRSIWVNIVGFLAITASAFGFKIGADVQNNLVELILMAVTGGTTLASIYYRVKADSKIVP